MLYYFRTCIVLFIQQPIKKVLFFYTGLTDLNVRLIDVNSAIPKEFSLTLNTFSFLNLCSRLFLKIY